MNFFNTSAYRRDLHQRQGQIPVNRQSNALNRCRICTCETKLGVVQCGHCTQRVKARARGRR